MSKFKSQSRGGRLHLRDPQYKLVETHTRSGKTRDLQKDLALDEARGQLEDSFYAATLSGESAQLVNHGFTVQLADREIRCVEQPIPFFS